MNHVKFFGVYEKKLVDLMARMEPYDILYEGTDAVYELGRSELSLGVWRKIATRLKGLVPDELQHRVQYGPEYMAFDMTPKGPVKKDIHKPERVGEIQQFFGYGLVEVYNKEEAQIIVNGLEEVGKDEESQEGNNAFHIFENLKNNFINSDLTHLLIYCEV